MLDPKSKKPLILHGNNAKVDDKNDFFTCQSYKAHTEPKQFDFDTIPGNEDDLNNARENYEEE